MLPLIKIWSQGNLPELGLSHGSFAKLEYSSHARIYKKRGRRFKSTLTFWGEKAEPPCMPRQPRL